MVKCAGRGEDRERMLRWAELREASQWPVIT